MQSDKKFYITTPIYYVNARPHIGHAYSTIVADVIARRHRLLGDDTYFLTGTDEHGQKIERSAAAAGIPPQEFADQVSKTFSDLWKRMGLLGDKFSKDDPLFHRDFIRTTEPRHKQGVQKLFAALLANGAIEEGTYTGQYCVSDEAYVEVGPGEPCPDCGRITETISESNYYFKLSAYQEKLINLIESDTLKIRPETRRNEVLSFLCGNLTELVAEQYDRNLYENSDPPGSPPSPVNLPSDPLGVAETQKKIKRSAGGRPYRIGALKDLSISRTSFKWGIPVLGDESHVIYVWLDALANYMTAVGYGSDEPEDIAKFDRYWPANLHLVGKEIIRFHCVYWPAFLMALRPSESPLSEAEWNDKWLPKSIVANGWLLFEESKMSKSRGNVVRTETILDAFGLLSPPPTQLLSSFDEVGESAVLVKAPQPLTPTKKRQDLFATDVLRYFLLREIPFGQDGSFSFVALWGRYNSDLVNGYGNLVSRVLNLAVQYFSSAYSPRGPLEHSARMPPFRETDEINEPFSLELKEVAMKTVMNAGLFLENLEFTKALETIWALVAATDSFVSAKAPWKLLKEIASASNNNEDQILTARHGVAILEFERIIYTAAESIRIISALAYPVLPYATAQVWSQLGLGDIEAAAKNGELKDLKWGGLKPGTKLGSLAPIFPRAPKELIQTMIDIEEQNAQAAKPQTSLIDEAAPTAAENHPSTDPAAGPRTSSLPVENPGSHVAGSAAITTERPETPPHTEAPASAPFANAAAASDVPDTPQIAIDDFVKIDLRVAKIIVAERIPKADKLLRLEVDLGYEKRQILSGIAEWYKPEELVGRNIVVIANLAPRKMRGLESHGMLLAASQGENGKPVLATFGEEIALGSRLR